MTLFTIARFPSGIVG